MKGEEKMRSCEIYTKLMLSAGAVVLIFVLFVIGRTSID